MAGWPRSRCNAGDEESPDSLRQRCRVTPGRGNPTESATENRPPFEVRAADLRGVRVKRWGKSPPQRRQRLWHGKPHREQCRIGPPRGMSPGPLQPQAGRVGSWSPPATAGREEWSSREERPQGRTSRTESGLQAVRAIFFSATLRRYSALTPHLIGLRHCVQGGTHEFHESTRRGGRRNRCHQGL